MAAPGRSVPAGGAGDHRAPLVSVVVPCFRSARFLRRAVEAALAQTVRDLEVVVVDNASDDATLAVAEALAATDPRVRVHRNESNLGPVRNWRRGVELARGRYAGLCFSDDWYRPEFLERALALLEPSDDVGLVYSAVEVVDEDAALRPLGRALAYRLEGPPLHPAADYLQPMLERFSFAHPVSPGAALMRRPDLARWLAAELPDPHGAGYLEHGAGPDLWVYLQACRDYPRFGHLADAQVCFSNHGGNLTYKPGVQAAYRLALLAWLDAGRPAGVDPAAVAATAWGGLRHDARRAVAAPRVGLGGWVALGSAAVQAAFADARREEVALVCAEHAARPPGQVPPDARIAFPALSEDPASPYRVTALVSIYRSARYLRGCLEDLTAQTLHARGELEILCVDTGSPEEDGGIVREFQARSPHVRSLRTEDRRPLYQAWNMAIVAARGRYLTSANTDDRHAPDALEKLAAALDADPGAALAYADQIYTAVVNETLATTTSRWRRVWTAGFSYATLRSHCMAGPQPMWRRALHATYGLFDEAFHSAGDWEFWLRIGARERFVKVDEVLGLYFSNPDGLENSHPRSLAESQACRDRYQIAPWEASGSAFAVHDVSAGPGRPDLSVVVAAAGRALETLPLAVSSVAMQTLELVELVLVDDGRSGDLAQLVRQLRLRRPRLAVRHLRAKARGLAAARAEGAAAASGRFIALLGDEDLLDPAFGERLLLALSREPMAGLAYADLHDPASGAVHQPAPFDLGALAEGPVPSTVLLHRNVLAVAGGPRPDDPDADHARRLLQRWATRGVRGLWFKEPLVHRAPRRSARAAGRAP